MAGKDSGSINESEVKRIIKDHKVFWTNSNIKWSVDGNRRN
jgi:hypothetical protein